MTYSVGQLQFLFVHTGWLTKHVVWKSNYSCWQFRRREAVWNLPPVIFPSWSQGDEMSRSTPLLYSVAMNDLDRRRHSPIFYFHRNLCLTSRPCRFKIENEVIDCLNHLSFGGTVCNSWITELPTAFRGVNQPKFYISRISYFKIIPGRLAQLYQIYWILLNYWGMHLTPVTTICSIPPYGGRLPKKLVWVWGTV